MHHAAIGDPFALAGECVAQLIAQPLECSNFLFGRYQMTRDDLVDFRARTVAHFFVPLTTSNILDWNITINDGVNSATLTPANTTLRFRVRL